VTKNFSYPAEIIWKTFLKTFMLCGLNISELKINE